MKRAQSYAPTQQTFDYKRATKLKMLERMNVACGCRANGKRFCHCGMALKSLLKALDGFARDHREFAVTVARLAESMGASPATVKRVIAKAVSLGYLKVTPGDGAKSPAPGKSKSGTRSTYEIQWLKIWNQTEEGQADAASRENEPPSNENEPPSRMSHPVAQNEPPPPPRMSHPVAQNEPPVPPPTNTTNYRPSSSSETTTTEVSDSILQKLRAVGVERPQTAWQKAMANRLPPETFEAVLDHAQANAGRWPGAVIFSRLTSPDAITQEPAEGWFGENPNWRPAASQAATDVETKIRNLTIWQIRERIPELNDLIDELLTSGEFDRKGVQDDPTIHEALLHSFAGEKPEAPASLANTS